MNYLAINTSDRLEILLKTPKKTLYYCAQDKTLASVELLKRIDDMMRDADTTPAQMDYFCSVTGPGSFTGIRIGVSTVNAFSYALNKPAVGISLFEYIAFGQNRPLCVVIDSTADTCYIQNFGQNNQIESPTCIKTDSIDYQNNVIASSNFLPSDKNFQVFCPNKDAFATVVEQKIASTTPQIGGLLPVYLRKSQAERTAGEL